MHISHCNALQQAGAASPAIQNKQLLVMHMPHMTGFPCPAQVLKRELAPDTDTPQTYDEKERLLTKLLSPVTRAEVCPATHSAQPACSRPAHQRHVPAHVLMILRMPRTLHITCYTCALSLRCELFRITEVTCAWGVQICAAIAKQKRIQVAEALLEVPGGQVIETGAPHCGLDQAHCLSLHVMLDHARQIVAQFPETGAPL